MAGGEEGPAGGWERTIKHRVCVWVSGPLGGGASLAQSCVFGLTASSHFESVRESVGKFGFETGMQNGTRCRGLLE